MVKYGRIKERLEEKRPEKNDEGKIFITWPTLQALETLVAKSRNRLITLQSAKDFTGNGDRYHNNLFFWNQQQWRMILARMKGLHPALLNEDWKAQVVLIVPSFREKAGLGSKVRLRCEQGEEELILVSPLDVIIDPCRDPRWVSIDSPLGQALLGNKSGQTVVTKTPQGTRRITITDISPAEELLPQNSASCSKKQGKRF